MGVISNLLKPLKEQFKYRIRWRFLWRDWFLGRHACLGYEVLKHYKNLPREVNFQKGRADLLIAYWGNNILLPKSKRLLPVMSRRDVLPLIRQLEFFNCLPKKAPKFIFMDSYAELTDQLFVNSEYGWQFCCGYSDITHRQLFAEEFEAQGLLSLENLKAAYLKLFELFESRWGGCPYIFYISLSLLKQGVCFKSVILRLLRL